MKHTPGPWSIRPREIEYKPITPDNHEHKALIEEHGLDKPFKGISIGTDKGQVAIIPLDESSRANADLIEKCPLILKALKDMIKSEKEYCESEGIPDGWACAEAEKLIASLA